MTRTIWCGQVAEPNAIRNFALRRKSGESPSAPPIAKIVLATCSSRQRPRCRAKVALSILSPRSSSATSTDFCGISGGNRRGFLGHPGCGVARAAFRNFMNIEAAKAELAADIVEALAVPFGQFPLRALLQPADRNDDEAHQAFTAMFQHARVLHARTQATCASADSHRLEQSRSPSPPSDPASTIARDCRIREPRV